MSKEITERQGKAVASLYLGKLQRGKLSRTECEEEIRQKLDREGYSRGSILGVLSEFNHLADKHGDYKW